MSSVPQTAQKPGLMQQRGAVTLTLLAVRRLTLVPRKGAVSEAHEAVRHTLVAWMGAVSSAPLTVRRPALVLQRSATLLILLTARRVVLVPRRGVVSAAPRAVSRPALTLQREVVSETSLGVLRLAFVLYMRTVQADSLAGLTPVTVKRMAPVARGVSNKAKCRCIYP